MAENIHATAIVHASAEIADGVEVGPYCTVGPNVKIGAGTKLISHVVLDGWTTIGERNSFFPFSVIGAIPQDLKYKGEKTEVIIGDDNQIRESVTINLGTVGGGGVTRVGNSTLIMACTHLGHDSIVKDHAIIANGVAVAGHVTIEEYAFIGGLSGIAQFCRVGAYSYMGGQSGIEKDIPPYCIGVGQRPITVKGANIVGLRRRGFPAEKITKINEAIKLWTRHDVQKEQCLLEIESQYGEVPEIRAFLDFIRGSDYGVAR